MINAEASKRRRAGVVQTTSPSGDFDIKPHTQQLLS